MCAAVTDNICVEVVKVGLWSWSDCSVTKEKNWLEFQTLRDFRSEMLIN